MPTSRMRKEIMYSFTRVLIGPEAGQDADPRQGVVSTTSSRLMPSMPTLYWMPKTGSRPRSPGTGSRRRSAAQAGRTKPSSDQRQRERDQRRAQRHQRTARRFCARQEGEEQRAHERREDDERQDRDAARSIISGSTRKMRHDGDDDQPDGDAQRVVLDAPGLDLADLAAGAPGSARDAVDRAVDDGTSNQPAPLATRRRSARTAGR